MNLQLPLIIHKFKDLQKLRSGRFTTSCDFSPGKRDLAWFGCEVLDGPAVPWTYPWNSADELYIYDLCMWLDIMQYHVTRHLNWPKIRLWTCLPVCQSFLACFRATSLRLLKYEDFDSLLKSDLGKQKDETTGCGEIKICECSMLCVEQWMRGRVVFDRFPSAACSRDVWPSWVLWQQGGLSGWLGGVVFKACQTTLQLEDN